MDPQAGALIEKRALQIAVAIAGFVPVLAGAAGALRPELLELAATPVAASHGAYLSGLLLGLGLAFWSTVPAIDKRGSRFALLTGIVFLGGLARLFTAARLGVWTPSVTLPLLMELAVTPGLFLWQRRLAKRAA